MNEDELKQLEHLLKKAKEVLPDMDYFYVTDAPWGRCLEGIKKEVSIGWVENTIVHPTGELNTSFQIIN